jgi:hypothetical protein
MANNPELYSQSDVKDWSFRSWHVGLDEGGQNTNPITAESVFVAAGPARLTHVSEDIHRKLFPIGLLENAQVSQQKRLQKIREIGSRRCYIIGSHASGNLSMSRVMYSHASLLRALTIANDDWEDIDNPPGANFTEEAYSGDAAQETSERVFFSNLQSELFDRPIGLLFYFLDQRNNPYGGTYLEDAMVQNHSFSLAAQGVAISERVTMMFDRAQPVAVSEA